MRILSIFITILFSSNVFSEYRVYQYYAHSKIENLNNSPYEVITSTLDAKSYIAYHGGRDSIELKLLRSWMCLGNTSKQAACTISDGKELEPAVLP